MILAGAIYCVAGAWNMPLNYLPSGLGLSVSGLLICRRRVEGAWIYLLTFLLITVGAWWQVGSNGPAFILRIAVPATILILVLTITPKLIEYRHDFEIPATISAGLLLLVGVALIVFGPSSPTSVTSQQTPPSATRMDDRPLGTISFGLPTTDHGAQANSSTEGERRIQGTEVTDRIALFIDGANLQYAAKKSWLRD